MTKSWLGLLISLIQIDRVGESWNDSYVCSQNLLSLQKAKFLVAHSKSTISIVLGLTLYIALSDNMPLLISG